MKCPIDDMDGKIEKIKTIKDEDETIKQPTMWGSLFGDKEKPYIYNIYVYNTCVYMHIIHICICIYVHVYICI